MAGLPARGSEAEKRLDTVALLNASFHEPIEAERDAYKALSSIEEIWFLWPTEMHLDQHVRAGEEWHIRTLVAGAAEGHTFGVWIPLRELYRLVL